MTIYDVKQSDYLELLDVWEQSVRATHDFLTEQDIQNIRKQIADNYFDSMTLKGFKDSNNRLLGFSGVSDRKLEMLFVLPSAQGKGIGYSLCRYSIDNLNVQYVDVNEQNPKGLSFYKKVGFKIINRSHLDNEGRPFPILHLSL